MFASLIDAIVATKQIIVGAKNNLIRTGNVYANTIVCKALGCVQIKNKNQASTLESDDFVILMLVAYECLNVKKVITKI